MPGPGDFGGGGFGGGPGGPPPGPGGGGFFEGFGMGRPPMGGPPPGERMGCGPGCGCLSCLPIFAALAVAALTAGALLLRRARR